MWRTWRNAAGWPDEGTFHSLRHYFPTRLITSGGDHSDAQDALRHSSLRITLETSVHWWPRKTAAATSSAGLCATRAPNENGARRPARGERPGQPVRGPATCHKALTGNARSLSPNGSVEVPV
ncbi:tyrosine-type recombinase/integrase [Micromonospora sp. NPDC127501]|uniref:tyrosine-type recombinase/integrase n=1 Tax=Micromonospora sp. NPDC127501 TaxID=3154872 RepID=UPI003329003B